MNKGRNYTNPYPIRLDKDTDERLHRYMHDKGIDNISMAIRHMIRRSLIEYENSIKQQREEFVQWQKTNK